MRPRGKDPNPQRTDEKYCTYYPRHRDYGYRPAYIERLVRECSAADGYEKLTGKHARDKATGALVVTKPQTATDKLRTSTPSPNGRPPSHPCGRGDSPDRPALRR